jgi:hypothetical protein
MLSDPRENGDAAVVKIDVTYSCRDADVEDGAKVGAVAVPNSQQCVSEEKDGKEE